MAIVTGDWLIFLIGFVISAVIIYVVTKLLGETEGIGTALIAAIVGSIIYLLAYFLLGPGIWASVLAGIAWLIALGTLYNIGWVKAFVIALLIWALANLISYILPTATGPL